MSKIRRITARRRLVNRRTLAQYRRVNAYALNQLVSSIVYLQEEPESIENHFNYRRSVQSTRKGLRQDAKNVARDLHKSIHKFQEQSVA